MKKMKIKVLSVILAVICLATIMSISSSAQIYSGSIGTSTKWTLDTETGHLLVEGTPGIHQTILTLIHHRGDNTPSILKQQRLLAI